MDDALATFEGLRPRLFGIAYRMLGTVGEAEDIVQDAWLRWQGADRDAVREPAAFLATTVTRLAINQLGSARARRESYVGPWLPEPVSTELDPLVGAERAEALELAVLLLLERLTPAERAAYVLHEAFDYPYRRIAEVLETSEANARQLGTRARAHVARERGTSVTAAERERLFAAFLAAAQHGDLEGLETLLAEDALTLSDGGGLVTAARVPIEGRQRVARFLLGIVDKFGQGATYELASINGQPAVLTAHDGVLDTVMVLDIAPGSVRQVLFVRNPRKLEQLAVTFRDHARS